MNEEESADQTSFPRTPVTTHLRIVGCGFLMGAADIVPGVSGGTVALIVGVYERLINAISQCNRTFLKLVFARKWQAAAVHIDLKFVFALAVGIATGILGLASLMNHLLTQHMSLTFATFSGMILASSLLVARRIPSWKMQHYGVLILGSLIALRLVTLPALQNPPDTLWYMLLSGMIGITAMILPGISGAFILLLLNRYHFITESIKGILHGELSIAVLTSLSVFAMGCVMGLLGFSRVLHWLLKRHHDGTMAVLCGFMLGSLYRLWPFQRDTTPQITKFKDKVFEHVMPDGLTRHALVAVALCVAGCAVILVLDFVSSRKTVNGGHMELPNDGEPV